MIFLAGSAASGKTKKAVAYGWKERKTSDDGGENGRNHSAESREWSNFCFCD